MADYQGKLHLFETEGVRLFAVSTDSAEDAGKMAVEHKLSFPVLYGLPGPQTAAAWGAYYEERRDVLHATNFVLAPDGTVASATYSTGPIGRVTADDALRFIRSRKKAWAAK